MNNVSAGVFVSCGKQVLQTLVFSEENYVIYHYWFFFLDEQQSSLEQKLLDNVVQEILNYGSRWYFN